MSRLFITGREIAFINDIAKELVSDVIGQRIFLHQISAKLTDSHDIYNEAINKAFNNPIELPAIVDAISQEETQITQFGVDSRYKLEVFLSYRDVVDRNVTIQVGDFFSYGDKFFEITQTREVKNIYGQVEHKAGIVLNATVARKDQFKARIHGPTDIKYNDEDAVQNTFVQTRGEAENSQGETNDTRQLKPVIGEPITGVKEVSEKAKTFDGTINPESSFYGDE